MKKVTLSVSAALLATLIPSSIVASDTIKVLDDLTLEGQIRPRYETAQISENNKDRANALTVRTSLKVTSKKVFDTDMLGFTTELTSVNPLGADQYNSTDNGRTNYDVVVDPNQARVSQAYLDVKLPAATVIRAGRQAVNLDNQRFIGSVDWRQMPQTLDAVAVVSNPVAGLNFVGAYVYGINSVKVHENNKAAETGSAVANLSYKLDDMLKLRAYSYMIESNSDTFGAAAEGSVKAGDLVVGYLAEYAIQQDPTLESDTVKNVVADANYYNLDLSVAMSGFGLGVNYEVLGEAEGDATKGFHTPLATLHKFNGWADVFLGSENANGLIDTNVRASYVNKSFGKVEVVYHTFAAQSGEEDLGSEFDAILVTKLIPVEGLTTLVKGAFYSKGDTAAGDYVAKDKSVAWLQLDYRFKI
jgi:hypothetical protein